MRRNGTCGAVCGIQSAASGTGSSPVIAVFGSSGIMDMQQNQFAEMYSQVRKGLDAHLQPVIEQLKKMKVESQTIVVCSNCGHETPHA